MIEKNVKLGIAVLIGMFMGIIISECSKNIHFSKDRITLQSDSLAEALNQSFENGREMERIHQRFIDDLVKIEMDDPNNYWFVRLEIEYIYTIK